MARDGAVRVACAVLELAVADLASADPRLRDSARRFLTAPTRREDRAFWCHLAGLDDDALVEAVNRPAFKVGCKVDIDSYTIAGTRLDGETLHRHSD